MGKRFFKYLAIILLISTILAPLITYSYLTNTYTNKERNLQHQMDSLQSNLQSKINTLDEENSQLTNLTQPYLLTDLGWYLHPSNDPVPSSQNTFTIYGTIYNIGQMPANNTELTIKFYGHGTLLQTSTINLGNISSTTNFNAPFDIGTYNIDCSVADQVTNVDISISPL